MTPEQADALDIARELVAAGVPVFRAVPHLAPCPYQYCRGADATAAGFHLPLNWQNAPCSTAGIDAWTPGDALGAVGGHGADFGDTDPRNGGTESREAMCGAGIWPRVYGVASTPNGGMHEIFAPVGVGKGKLKSAPGIDFQFGTSGGTDHGFVWIAPTVRFNLAGVAVAYRWTVRPDLSDIAGDDSGAELAEALRAERGARRTRSDAVAADPFDGPNDPHAGPIPAGQRHSMMLAYVGRLIELGLRHDEAEILFAKRWKDCDQAGYVWTLEAALRNPFEDAWARYLHPSHAPVADAQVDAAPSVEATGAVAEVEASSWTPEDLGPMLDGSHAPVRPTLFPREDGEHLLYPGLVHSFHGESESGKSMVAQAECARVLRSGGHALYIDFESDAATVVPRLLAMGATVDQIKSGFTYVRPDVRPSGDVDRPAYEALLTETYAVAIIDGVTESMGVFGVESSNNNDQVALWVRWFPRRFARTTGAAVVLIDHVTKATDSRGRFAIGAQAKMAGLDGAGYLIETRKPLGRGMRGAISMRVGKDRPGAIRPISGEYESRDRTQETAYVVVDSTVPDTIRIEVRGPMPEVGGDPAMMEAVSRFLEKCAEPVSQAQVTAGVPHNATKVRHAANALGEAGYVLINVTRGANQHSSIKPFRASDLDD